MDCFERKITNILDDNQKLLGKKIDIKKAQQPSNIIYENMHIKGKHSQPDEHTTIKVKGTQLEKVDSFKYLGSIKSSDGTCLQDIKTRIAMAKQKMLQLNNIWKGRGIPNHLKMSLLKCLVWPVVMYGCEAWTLRKEE